MSFYLNIHFRCTSLASITNLTYEKLLNEIKICNLKFSFTSYFFVKTTYANLRFSLVTGSFYEYVRAK